MNYKIISLVLGAILLTASTAATSVYLTKRNLQTDNVAAAGPAPKKTASAPAHAERPAQKAASNCNDNNIAGKAVGGIGGGILGSMLGEGKGKTATTIGGALGGAYLGGKTIPLQNETCK